MPNGCNVTSLLTKVETLKQEEVKPTTKKDFSKLGEESFKILENRKTKGVCQHCGGKFTFFTKKCTFCGKKKDY